MVGAVGGARCSGDNARVGELGIFTSLDKALVIQDVKIFNETPMRNERCAVVLTKLLYLLYQGQRLNTKEATNVFFSVTKAFQSKNVRARPSACQSH